MTRILLPHASVNTARVYRSLHSFRILQRQASFQLYRTSHNFAHDHSTLPSSESHFAQLRVPTHSRQTLSADHPLPVKDGVQPNYTVESLLPVTCPGCGAISHAVNPQEAGYYSKSRKAVKAYLRHQNTSPAANVSQVKIHITEDNTSDQASEHRDSATIQDGSTQGDNNTIQLENPICDRCHDLVYNQKGHSIAHPTVQALADSIAESPFQRNHVYHVLDAADFPMSLIPNIFRSLEIAKPRSQNRRARTKFTTKPAISFIITRSDLLGPSKEIVDKMMPFFQQGLRSALGRRARDMRLGNVHLVSSKRGWWTKELKDSIWERGGGNWMVGKANVGKSNLFPVLFPKGSGERAPIYAELGEKGLDRKNSTESVDAANDYLSEDSLLPPSQPEVPFPTMPVVSNLPGTTASPIRLPFGNHKGELIDLPGLDRGNLEQYVHSDYRSDLVMQHRPNVKQHIIKAGQSLLLGGGLIRITPRLDPTDRSMTMLAYPFVPLDAHVTATDKAAGIQQQEQQSGIRSIVADGVGTRIKPSGTYKLETDVTKTRAGALMRAGVPISKLPFRVYSTDILIEGVGWIELVCQVRKRRASPTPDTTSLIECTRLADDEDRQSIHNQQQESSSDFKPFATQEILPEVDSQILTNSHFSFPEIQVHSPNGQHVGQRDTLGAWAIWNEGRSLRHDGKAVSRPRRSMRGVKKREKAERRIGHSGNTA